MRGISKFNKCGGYSPLSIAVAVSRTVIFPNFKNLFFFTGKNLKIYTCLNISNIVWFLIYMLLQT
jgi:hypothetical protein